ncbi:paaX, C-domain protein [Mycobacterium xenopi 4042]|uniref:PaaX, C-domain protein n=1 Tax=Mycobacterium xenopi 4042 TaxID=1299334 RepID=X7YJB8_MYCXE|nr:paaX, C-domain protein [Mycobacterium xenopi 4042]
MRWPPQPTSRPVRGSGCDCAPPAYRSGAARRAAADELAGAKLRAAYNDFAAELTRRRNLTQLVEAR